MSKPTVLFHFGQSIPSQTPTKFYFLPAGPISSACGELVLWDQQATQPILVFYSSLTQLQGELISLTDLEFPDENSPGQFSECIATFHQDHRIRLWNIKRRACFKVSSSILSLKSIQSIQGIQKSSILICGGQSSILIMQLRSMQILGNLNFQQQISPLNRIILPKQGRAILKFGFKEVQFSYNLKTGLVLQQESLMNYQEQIRHQRQLKLKQNIIKYIQARQSNQKSLLKLKLLEKPFLKKYYRYLRGVINQVITCSTIIFLEAGPMLFLGFQTGRLLGLPMVINDSENSLFLFHKQLSEHRISYMKGIKSLLIVSSSDGRLQIFDFQKGRNLRQPKNDSKQPAVYYVPFQKLQVFESQCNRPVIYLIQLLKSVDRICMVLQDRSLLIYNTNLKSACIYLIQNKRSKILGVLNLSSQTILVVLADKFEIIDRKGLLREGSIDQLHWDFYFPQSQHLESASRNNYSNRISYLKQISGDDLSKIKSEIWGQSSKREGVQLALKLAQRNIHIYSISLALSKKYALIALPLRLDMRRAQSWNNIAHILQYDPSLVSQTQAADLATAFLGLDQTLDQQVRFRRTFKLKRALQGIGTSFAIFLKDDNLSQAQNSSRLCSYYLNLRYMQNCQLKKSERIVCSISRSFLISTSSLALFSLNQNQKISESSLELMNIILKNQDIIRPTVVQSLEICLQDFPNSIVKFLKETNNRKFNQEFYKLCLNLLTAKGIQNNPIESLSALRLININVKLLQKNQIIQLLVQLFGLVFLFECQNQQTYFKNSPELAKSAAIQKIKLSESLENTMKENIFKTACTLTAHSMVEALQLFKNSLSSTSIHILYPACILQLLRNLLRQEKEICKQHIQVITQMMLKTLDPSLPQIRRWTYHGVYKVLRLLLTYSGVAFHQQTQKLAVYGFNSIGIYDLKAAVKWRSIQCTNPAVISFSPNAKYLSGYLPKSNELMVWKIGYNGLWGGLLWLQGKQTRAFAVQRYLSSKQLKMSWRSDEREVALVGESDVLNFRL